MFKSVWGFDPDEVAKAQALLRHENTMEDACRGAGEEEAARIPSGSHAQVYELR